MRLLPRPLTCRFPGILLLSFLAISAHADEWNQYRIQGNLFSDYKPAFQQRNRGEQQESAKVREREQIDREFQRKQRQAYSGAIDNRDYSRRSRDDRMRYHSPDRNRHRHSGAIDNNTYGATPYRAPSAGTAQRWVGPDYSAPNKRQNTGTANHPDGRYGTNTVQPPARPAQNPYADNPRRQEEKYYGARQGEPLYPYTTKPVKGTTRADQAQNKDTGTSRPDPEKAYAAAKPRDPSYGGNRAWKVPRQNQVDTSRFYQDEVARYRREHRQKTWCKDGSVSGEGSGACSGHGGLLKRG